MEHKWDTLIAEGQRLLDATAGCRDDMHEPDNNGVSVANILGTLLNNATGIDLTLNAIEEGYQEIVVTLKQETQEDTFHHRFNLATLIALARFGTRHLVAEKYTELLVDKRGEKE